MQARTCGRLYRCPDGTRGGRTRQRARLSRQAGEDHRADRSGRLAMTLSGERSPISSESGSARAWWWRTSPAPAPWSAPSSSRASRPTAIRCWSGGLSNIVFNPSLYSKLGHDPMKEFTPITLVLGISYVLVGRKDLPYTTLAEVIDAARKEPGKLSMANAGVGTGQHLVAAALMNATGAKFLEVPYKGAQLAYPDILSGPRRLLHRFLSGRAAAHQGRQRPRDRDRRSEAQSADARCADHGGSRREGLRHRFMDGHFRARQDAAGGRRQTSKRDPRDPAGAEGALRESRRQRARHPGCGGRRRSSSANTICGRK